MAARVLTVNPDLIWEPPHIQRLWFFPDGSEYLQYSPHFHIVYEGGFRQNMPLCYMFIVVLEGKLSIKSYSGKTIERIDVRGQMWYCRGTERPAKQTYAMMLPAKAAYTRRRR